MWSILENVPFAFEKNVYSPGFGWNILYKSLTNVLFNANVFLLIFGLNDLFTDVSGMLRFPTIIVLLSFSPLCQLIFASQI